MFHLTIEKQLKNKQMKITSTKKISLIFASVFAFIAGLLILIAIIFKMQNFYAYIVFAMLISFILLYVTFSFIFNNLLIKKLKPIFDTIDTLKMPSEKIFESLESGHLLGEIDTKVEEWAKSKMAEIAILKSNEKYRKEFLGDVSHELKTPLFNIQGYILTLIEGGLKDKDINMKYLKRTDKNINRLISIVKDLETIARFETGERVLEFEEFDITKLIIEVFDIFEIKADEKKIKLKFDKVYNTPIWVSADKKRISDVLSNLVVNSIIYGKEVGITTAGIEQNEQQVFIHIEDDGIGIDEQDQQRVFERFFRVDKSRSKIQGGTGLGLSIVKHIIEAHKQCIKVKSQINIGTKFTFTLNKANIHAR
jgi:two-component system phosphate regulon sensor histidine kinase PhoR